jgi:hypothetical protein
MTRAARLYPQAQTPARLITELAKFARNQRVDLIIVAIPCLPNGGYLQILDRLWELPS